MMYFANNDGLLRHDGATWRVFPMPNYTIVRSVANGADGRIYAGAQSEFGYFAPDTAGSLHYTSLVGLLPPGARNFEDVWDIVVSDSDVFFRTNRSVFRFTGNRIAEFALAESLQAMFMTPEGLVVQGGSDGLYLLAPEGFKPFHRIPGLNCPITAAIPWTGDTLLFATLKQGVFYLSQKRSGPWQTRADDQLFAKRIYSAAKLADGMLALGTSLDGLLVIDRQRRVFRHLRKENGLQNNNVLHVFVDLAGNAWLGLNNGIDCVVMPSRFSAVIPDGDLRGTGYTAAIHEQNLYLGVSNGVYRAPWTAYYDPSASATFHAVRGAEGQAWNLTSLGPVLWHGHHEGAFLMDNHQAQRISPDGGYWTFVELAKDYVMAGSYTGLSLFHRDPDGHWRFDGPIAGLRESCRIMVRERNGDIWISHPYRGVYRVRWSAADKFRPDIHFYDQSAGLPSNLNNYVFLLNDRAVFGTEKGVYRFDPGQERFRPDPDIRDWLGEHQRIKYLRDDGHGAIWYAAGDEVGRLRIADSGLRKEVTKEIFPELSGKLVGGFEFIFPIDEHQVLLGTEEGFIHFSDLAESSSLPLSVLITEVRVSGSSDSLLYGGYPGAADASPMVLAPGLNHLSFTFSAPEFGQAGLVEYRTLLDGVDDEWTIWSRESQRVISNINPGRHVFRVQARIPGGRISEESVWAFRLRPPWYAGIPARLVYALLVVGLFASIVNRQRRRFESEKARLLATHEEVEALSHREVQASKAALTEIQNQKLEAEIHFKNQELAMTTMHLVQKAELLLSIQEGLRTLRDKAAPDVKKEIRHLLNLLNFDLKLDEDWDHFAQYFDQVHVDFLKNLRDRFPQLSGNDYKLCAYLRMNLSTKEIAPLMNISVRGVEGSRYRLRRKLDLPNEANLTDFIMSLPPSVMPVANTDHHEQAILPTPGEGKVPRASRAYPEA